MTDQDKLSTSSLDSYVEAAAKINSEVKELLANIRQGQTTGDIFTDWALLNFGMGYKQAVQKTLMLKEYLAAKPGDLVLVSEGWVKPEDYYFGCGSQGFEDFSPPPDTYNRTHVGVLSDSGLVVVKHPDLDLVEKHRIDEETRIKSIGISESPEESEKRRVYHAYQSPLNLKISTKDGEQVLFDRRRDAYMTAAYGGESVQELKTQESIEFEGRGVFSLEYQEDFFQGSPNINASNSFQMFAPDRLTSMRIVAGKDLALQQLAKITGESKVMGTSNLQEVYDILKVKE